MFSNIDRFCFKYFGNAYFEESRLPSGPPAKVAKMDESSSHLKVLA
jgi:hypothetical protein